MSSAQLLTAQQLAARLSEPDLLVLDCRFALEDPSYGAQGADEPGQRFYFDYSRLAADLQRIRQGLQDYMTPSRAQPRDPSDLSGNYTLRGGPMP